jgi:hypothetical protein
MGLNVSTPVLTVFEINAIFPFGQSTDEPYWPAPPARVTPLGTIDEKPLVLGLKTPTFVAEDGVK